MDHKISTPLEDPAKRPPIPDRQLPLSQVGLENVTTQVRVERALRPAKASAAVSLIDVHSRGIHMSRLFKLLNQLHTEELSWRLMGSTLEQMLASHQHLSDSGYFSLEWELPVQRSALKSEESGWRSYPLRMEIESVRGQRALWLEFKVLYSSTCPCSAGLAAQATADRFQKDFAKPQVSQEEILQWLREVAPSVAVPHAQRSEAKVRVQLDERSEMGAIQEYIDLVESTLGTAVQAAVKREDEQEFARRNAQNLMFCEDAARALKAALMGRPELRDFHLEVRHFESLHAHDVVAKAAKNL